MPTSLMVAPLSSGFTVENKRIGCKYIVLVQTHNDVGLLLLQLALSAPQK